mgnify:CR=1 FL=1
MTSSALKPRYPRPPMPSPRLYDDLSPLWPAISPPEDYADEARHWRAALREHLGPDRNGRRHAILELGVGGGHNLSHLTADFDATAVDLSPRMLENSRRLNPAVEHHVGDMRTVRLGRTFDAVLIHDAVDYLTTEDHLRATFETAAVHLRPGGLLVCAPDWTRETCRDPQATRRGPCGPDGDVTFVAYEHEPDPSDTTIEVG